MNLNASALRLLSLLFLTSLIVTMVLSEDPHPVARHALGGYSPIDTEDSEVVERVQLVATFAVGRITEENPSYSFQGAIPDENTGLTYKVLRASQQVVAGMNYKMTIAVLNAEGQCVGAFKCTVYDRFGDLQVTNWGDEVSCAEATAMLKEVKPKEPGPET